jgi:hypothetical protein
MIHVSGNARQSFLFPAAFPAAYAFYSDPGHIFKYLPYVSATRKYSHNQFQVVYDKVELINYRVRIYANVEFVLDETEQALFVRPFDGGEIVKAKANLSAARAMGEFSSQSSFVIEGKQTRIDYRLQLKANLPTPAGLSFMPGNIIDTIAERITHSRIREIADGFIEQSIAAFDPQAVIV